MTLHCIHIPLSNRVLKDLQNWKEAPLDCVVLSLYQLQVFYLNETKRGLVGVGEYSIAQEYQFVEFDHLDVQYLLTTSPDERVKRINRKDHGSWKQLQTNQRKKKRKT